MRPSTPGGRAGDEKEHEQPAATEDGTPGRGQAPACLTVAVPGSGATGEGKPPSCSCSGGGEAASAQAERRPLRQSKRRLLIVLSSSFTTCQPSAHHSS